MNKLEECILKAVRKAQNSYLDMTGGDTTEGGWWLRHAPESYLQTVVAQSIFRRLKHRVYIDSSLKKIRSDQKKRGRPAQANAAKRPDLAIWHKSRSVVRAIIEIKIAWNKEAILEDSKKLIEISNSKTRKKLYILAYSEVKIYNNNDKDARKKLRGNLTDWKPDNKWSRIIGNIPKSNCDEERCWGAALYRCDNKL